MKEKIYLDNNATTALDPRVFSAMYNKTKGLPCNPSSVHSYGQYAKGLLYQAREEIANYLGKNIDEIIFTSSGTEALNLVLRGLWEKNSSGEIITSNIEHSAIFNTLKDLEGAKVHYLPVGPWGAVSFDQIKEAVSPATKMIVLSLVNTETGVKNDIEEIAAFAKTQQIPLVVDGIGIMGKEDFTLYEGISAACFSAHKFHGPKGNGFFYLSEEVDFLPKITGGAQEFGKRGGTENLEGILGTAKAVSLLKEELPEKSIYMKELRDYFEQMLFDHLDDLVINGKGPRVVNTSNLAFLGVDGESLLMHLDQQGICASHGSACSAGALEPSRVLSNMGLDRERVRSSIRFSISRMTSKEEIECAATIIIKTVTQLQSVKSFLQ